LDSFQFFIIIRLTSNRYLSYIQVLGSILSLPFSRNLLSIFHIVLLISPIEEIVKRKRTPTTIGPSRFSR